MKVQGRRKRGRPRRRWLNKLKDDINEKGLYGVEVYDRAMAPPQTFGECFSPINLRYYVILVCK